ncbi:MAG: WXG100 family type VII secretion target [Nocardioides alkalitolerans]
MSNVQIGEGSLSSAAQLVAEAKIDLDRKSQTLSSKIQGIGAQWGGQGAAAFHQLHNAWQEKQQTITNALNNFEASLRDTETDAVSTDTTQADTFQSQFNRLG